MHLTCPGIRRYHISYISNISYIQSFNLPLLKKRTIVFGIGHILNSSFYFWCFPNCYQSADFRLRKLKYYFFLLGIQDIIKELLGCLKILTLKDGFPQVPKLWWPWWGSFCLATFPARDKELLTVITDTNSGPHMLGTATHGKKSNRRHQKPALS